MRWSVRKVLRLGARDERAGRGAAKDHCVQRKRGGRQAAGERKALQFFQPMGAHAL